MRKVFHTFYQRLTGVALAALFFQAPASAQPVAPAPSAAAPTSTAERIKAEAGKRSILPPPKSFELTAEQKARFQSLLPKAYAKLSQRAAFHVVAIGDDIIEMQGPGAEAGDLLKAYPAQFLTSLTEQFFYTGGVRLIRPPKGKPAKATIMMGPEITLRSLGRPGKTMQNAMQSLTTYGFESQPDLVIVCFGMSDAHLGLELGAYARAAQEVIDTVRSRGSEMILLGSTLPADEPVERGMGKLRAYTDMLRDLAAENKLPFADLGDLAALVKLQPTVTEPAKVLESVKETYRHYFNWETGVDFVHPRADLHERLGNHIMETLINGTKPMPWQLSKGVATLDSAEQLTLSYEVENASAGPLTVSVQPLPTPRWLAKDGAQVIELKAGKKQAVKVIYARAAEPAVLKHATFSSHEPLLRLPVLVAAAGMVRIEDIRAELRPIAVVWKMDSQYNVEGQFMLDNLLVNTSGTALKGIEWTAEWNNQKLTGKLDVAAGSREALALKFDLPKGDGRREASPLALAITVNGTVLRWERFIEVQRNMGLRDNVDLRHDGKQGTIRMRADADANTLFLTYDFAGVELANDAQGIAMRMALNLDARSFGKRLGFGVTEALQIQCGAEDGVGVTGNIAPWAFGTGYGMGFDDAAIKCQLSSSGNGVRRFTVTVPRSYLYLHEWALGNGNSELGIGVTMNLWQAPHAGQTVGGYAADMAFSLTQNGRLPDDAEGLAVLELSDKPTRRWTVVVW